MQHSIMQLTEGHMSAMPEQWPVSLQTKFHISCWAAIASLTLSISGASLHKSARVYA